MLWTAEKKGQEKIPSDPLPVLTFGIQELDITLPAGGLSVSAIHEFIVLPRSEGLRPYPPCLIPAFLAQQAISFQINHTLKEAPFLVWIGRKCWPSIFLLQSLFASFFSTIPDFISSHCLFIDPPESRLHWTIETALRSAAVSAVIADIGHCPAPLSRRFSLLAKYHSTTGFFIRPPAAANRRTFSSSTWLISPSPAFSRAPAWHLQLRHVRGSKPEKCHWHISSFYKENYESSSGISTPTLSLHLLSGVKQRHNSEREPLAQEQASYLHRAREG